MKDRLIFDRRRRVVGLVDGKSGRIDESVIGVAGRNENGEYLFVLQENGGAVVMNLAMFPQPAGDGKERFRCIFETGSAESLIGVIQNRRP